jgi:hypothetical protein
MREKNNSMFENNKIVLVEKTLHEAEFLFVSTFQELEIKTDKNKYPNSIFLFEKKVESLGAGKGFKKSCRYEIYIIKNKKCYINYSPVAYSFLNKIHKIVCCEKQYKDLEDDYNLEDDNFSELNFSEDDLDRDLGDDRFSELNFSNFIKKMFHKYYKLNMDLEVRGMGFPLMVEKHFNENV